MSSIQQIKSEVDLVHFAITNDFHLDRQKTSKSCKIFHGPVGKIGISQQDGAWVYYNFHSKTGGSVIDLYMDLHRVSFPEAVKYLETQIGVVYDHKDPVYVIKQSCFDKDVVQRELKELKFLKTHHSFLYSRGIKVNTLTVPRFSRSVMTDRYNNAVFPHYGKDGYTGSEKKNKKFAGFSDSGKKALWFSAGKESDTRLVFCESGLDCLSYFQIKDDGNNRYFSIGGNLSPEQIELIDAVFVKNQDREAVLAYDNDKAGREYVKQFKQLWTNRKFTVDIPEGEGNDWNDLI